MTNQNLEDLFVQELEEMYYVETRLVDILRDLVEDANNEALSRGFSNHREETRDHVERIERVFDALGREPSKKQSHVLEALVKEHDEFVEGSSDEQLHDLYDMQAGIKTERIEISAYEGLLLIAGKLNYPDEVTDPLEDNLSDEKSALRKLEGLSKGSKIKSMISQLI